MSTLLIKLCGPMQSWGVSSRFTERDTLKEPSKSGVIGILAAALGIDRTNWVDLEPLTKLKMAVRHDQPGILQYDYQTSGCGTGGIINSEGKILLDGVVSKRYYLADAKFLVGLEGPRELLEKVQAAIKNPVWCLGLGRKSYLPSEPMYFNDGIVDLPLKDAILSCKCLGNKKEDFKLYSYETVNEGSIRKDQPITAFSERSFGRRYIKTEMLSLKKWEN